MCLATKILHVILLFYLLHFDWNENVVVLAGSIDLNRTPSPEPQESMQAIDRNVVGKSQSSQFNLEPKTSDLQLDSIKMQKNIKRRHRVGGGKSIPMLSDLVKTGKATEEDIMLLYKLKQDSQTNSRLRSKRYREGIVLRKKNETMTPQDEKYYQDARNRYYKARAADPVKTRMNRTKWIKDNQVKVSKSRKRWREQHPEQERERKREWKRKQRLKKSEARM